MTASPAAADARVGSPKTPLSLRASTPSAKRSSVVCGRVVGGLPDLVEQVRQVG
jgi:hypothetical protein